MLLIRHTLRVVALLACLIGLVPIPNAAAQVGPIGNSPSFFGGMPPCCQNLKYVPIVGANLPTGDNDLYTVPSGPPARAAAVFIQNRVYNPSAGSITYFPELKVSGTYYRLDNNATLTTGTGTQSNANGFMVLNAGESISVNSVTTAGLNLRMAAWEFDASDTRLATSRNLALASGDNTLYTVPSGKSAIALGNGLAPGGNGFVLVVNNTGGSLNYYVNAMPSGSSAGSTNQLYPATANADKSRINLIVQATLAAGDLISVNSSGADAGGHQIAWMTYYQI